MKIKISRPVYMGQKPHKNAFNHRQDTHGQMPDSANNDQSLLVELNDKYGPFVGGANLRKLLGFMTYESFRQAEMRDVLPVKVFSLPHRQGKFALTEDVAVWLTTTIQSVKEDK